MTKISNYTQFPNSILDHLADFIPSEFVVLGFIVRQTVGWHKRTVRIPLSLLATSTGLSRQTLSDAIDTLTAKGIVGVARTGKTSPGSYFLSCEVLESEDSDPVKLAQNLGKHQDPNLPKISTSTCLNSRQAFAQNLGKHKEERNSEKETTKKEHPVVPLSDSEPKTTICPDPDSVRVVFESDGISEEHSMMRTSWPKRGKGGGIGGGPRRGKVENQNSHSAKMRAAREAKFSGGAEALAGLPAIAEPLAGVYTPPAREAAPSVSWRDFLAEWNSRIPERPCSDRPAPKWPAEVISKFDVFVSKAATVVQFSPEAGWFNLRYLLKDENWCRLLAGEFDGMAKPKIARTTTFGVDTNAVTAEALRNIRAQAEKEKQNATHV